MAEIVLARKEPADITPADREAVRRVLFGVVDGLGQLNQARWRRFFNGLLRLQPGELVHVITRRPRSGPFHRRHMAIEVAVFEAQERIQDFDQFRLWLKVGAGWVDWMAGPKGGVVPIPRSLSYPNAGEDEMQEFHVKAMAFLRSEHAIAYLWPKLPAHKRDAAMDGLLSEFRE